MARVLNLGAGLDRSIPGAVTVDLVAKTQPDVVHDLDIYPWPFETDSFDQVICREVVEHLGDVIKAMEEMHRVTRAGGLVHIVTPHYSCSNSYTDPTHRRHLGYFSFDYFTDENQWGFYSEARFRMKRREIQFYGRYKNAPQKWLANRHPRLYEERFAWIFPAWYLVFDLEVVK